MNLDSVFEGVHARPPASALADADGAGECQLRDLSREVFMVEGKGFGRRVRETRDSSRLPHAESRSPPHSTPSYATTLADPKPAHSGQWGPLERVPSPLGRARSRVRVSLGETGETRCTRLLRLQTEARKYNESPRGTRRGDPRARLVGIVRACFVG